MVSVFLNAKSIFSQAESVRKTHLKSAEVGWDEQTNGIFLSPVQHANSSPNPHLHQVCFQTLIQCQQSRAMHLCAGGNDGIRQFQGACPAQVDRLLLHRLIEQQHAIAGQKGIDPPLFYVCYAGKAQQFHSGNLTHRTALVPMLNVFSDLEFYCGVIWHPCILYRPGETQRVQQSRRLTGCIVVAPLSNLRSLALP